MAPRTVYANLTDGLQSFSLWDQSLSDMGLLGAIPCSASGTNSIILTPLSAAFTPNVTAYSNYLLFSFVAAATSTGSVTVKAGTLAELPLYRMDAVTQATTGDINANTLYIVVYNSALNAASGGFQLLVPQTLSVNSSRTVTASGNITVSASDRVILVNQTVPGAANIILPAASTRTQPITVKDFAGAAFANPLTFVPSGTDKIDGQSSFAINDNYEAATLNPTTGGWWIG